MNCEKCNAREATVFFEQTVNGETKTMHLCHECAAKVKQEGFFKGFDLFGDQFFGGLFGISAPERTAGRTCPQCGASFADIRREGKVCCPACYAAFAAELEPTLRSLHGNVTHTGRAPAKQRAVQSKQTKLKELRSALQAAIASEQYEEAARLRDEIRTLEKEEN